MPTHEPGLGEKLLTGRAAQNERYDNLAHYMWKITTVNGRHQYREESLRNMLARSHVLTKDGEVHRGRMVKMADSLGVRHGTLPGDPRPRGYGSEPESKPFRGKRVPEPEERAPEHEMQGGEEYAYDDIDDWYPEDYDYYGDEWDDILDGGSP